MKKKLLFGLLMAALLVPWPVAYAYDAGPASGASYPVSVTPVAGDLTPQVTVYGGAFGSVQPGDLFYIDTANETMDVSFILFFTNTDDLAATYRSLTIDIGLSAENTDGSWTPVTDYGPASQVLFMSIRTGSIDFTVSGHRRYKVSVTHGCYYAFPVRAETPVALPEFYLTPTT
jgi:hypothetical protein